MSLKERDDAIGIIAAAIMDIDRSDNRTNTTYGMAGSIVLNKLLKAGYLNDKIIVNIEEVQDQMNQAIFKCKVKE